jgi:hypothetical protein
VKVDGRCHCGKIAFEANVDPATVTICHCTDCQNLTGSSFRANVQTPAESLVLLRGQPRIYIKTTAESGTRRAHAFCPDCGTPIYAAAVTNHPPTYSLRIGTLRQRAELRPRRQVWCRSALPWSMDLHEIARLERQ